MCPASNLVHQQISYLVSLTRGRGCCDVQLLSLLMWVIRLERNYSIISNWVSTNILLWARIVFLVSSYLCSWNHGVFWGLIVRCSWRFECFACICIILKGLLVLRLVSYYFSKIFLTRTIFIFSRKMVKNS